MLIHYLTSYNAKLYEATGKLLERSFSNYQAKAGNPNLLLAYSEDNKGTRRINPDYLNWYLQTFKHLIPPNLGGTAKGCICGVKPGKATFKVEHKPGCHNTLWNRNAFRWFHKVAAIKTWLDSLNSSNTPDYMVWLDCDCYFKQHLPNSVIEDLCGTAELCYLKGKKREAIESGILIFNLKEDGAAVITQWFWRYQKQFFLADNRWDDGYQLTQVVNDTLFICKDLVKGKAIGRPADDCPLTPYIGHNKGTHVRDHQLF